MPYSWVSKQTDAVAHWVTSTSCPMLVSTEDGGILWVNQAFEKLLGWSAVELVGFSGKPGKKWTDLTVETSDLEADQEMMFGVVTGERSEYYIRKQYRAKGGEAVHVMIHVLRWPRAGGVECFLVTVAPPQPWERVCPRGDSQPQKHDLTSRPPFGYPLAKTHRMGHQEQSSGRHALSVRCLYSLRGKSHHGSRVHPGSFLESPRGPHLTLTPVAGRL